MDNKISPEAEIGENCLIGPYSVVHPGVTLGAGSKVGSFCELGSPNGETLTIGESSLIQSHANVQGGSSFASELQVGQYTLVVGGVSAGLNVHIGANCELRGDMIIGDYTRIQSNVHLGKGVQIGDFVWILPNVLTANDPLPPSDVHLPQVIESLCVVAANCLLMPGVKLGFGSFIGASSVVRRNVGIGECVQGDPAVPFATIDRLYSSKYKIAHPWPRHFSRSLDDEGLKRARSLQADLMSALEHSRESFKELNSGM